MLKETGYKEKIEMLDRWLVEIIECVRGDLKQEHLKIDKPFCRRYFLGRHFNQVTTEEMAHAYRIDIGEGNEGLGEFIATRWLLRNTDLYNFFAEKLNTLTPDFEMLDELPGELAAELLQESIKQFGPTRTYLFSVLNSVVFPEELYENLRLQAEKETTTLREKAAKKQKAETLEALQKRHAREISALNDRHEKKMSGLQKKYLRDTESLKKQIGRLQKKLQQDEPATR